MCLDCFFNISDHSGLGVLCDNQDYHSRLKDESRILCMNSVDPLGGGKALIYDFVMFFLKKHEIHVPAICVHGICPDTRDVTSNLKWY